MWSKVACLFGVHQWSEWTPADPGNPGKQVRGCTRCSRVKLNSCTDINSWDYHLG